MANKPDYRADTKAEHSFQISLMKIQLCIRQIDINLSMQIQASDRLNK